jgi:hypothetical protein
MIFIDGRKLHKLKWWGFMVLQMVNYWIQILRLLTLDLFKV